MGAGSSLEAAFTLAGPIRAGSWHLVGDGLIFGSVDVTFDVVWRPRSGAGDRTLATFASHFDQPVGGFSAVPFEADAPGVAAESTSGDQLILRFTAAGAPGALYIPNGDGASAQGRIPSLALPP